jgi:hypothetical protein
MPISHKYKVIFIHIPKTAGTSVENVLGVSTINDFYNRGKTNDVLKVINTEPLSSKEYRDILQKSPQHYTLQEIKKIIDPSVFSDYLKFSIVRNPYDRFVSEYNSNEEFNFLSFDEFTDYAMSLTAVERNWLFDGHLETQTNFLSIDGGGIDQSIKIFKFEELYVLKKFMAELTGMIHFPHKLKSANRISFISFYTNKTENMIYEFYKDDFVKFNYDRLNL